jgi:hypothetical protein
MRNPNNSEFFSLEAAFKIVETKNRATTTKRKKVEVEVDGFTFYCV